MFTPICETTFGNSPAAITLAKILNEKKDAWQVLKVSQTVQATNAAMNAIDDMASQANAVSSSVLLTAASQYLYQVDVFDMHPNSFDLDEEVLTYLKNILKAKIRNTIRNLSQKLTDQKRARRTGTQK